MRPAINLWQHVPIRAPSVSPAQCLLAAHKHDYEHAVALEGRPPIDATSRKAGLVSQVAHLRCTHQKQAQDNHQHLDARKPMPSTARLARAPLHSSDLEARHEGTLRETSGVDRHQGAWERASPSWSRVAERR